jgi:HEAT repeat protein
VRVWLSLTELGAASVPDLVGFLASPHYGVRSQAARELANRKQQPELAWPGLVRVRADTCWMVRMQVARGAVHLAAPAEQAVPVLRELLADADEVVQSYAAWALEQFGQGA